MIFFVFRGRVRITTEMSEPFGELNEMDQLSSHDLQKYCFPDFRWKQK
jgi:hypothetical protein